MLMRLTSWENQTPAAKGPPVLSTKSDDYWLNTDYIVGMCRRIAPDREVTEIRVHGGGIIYVSETPEEIYANSLSDEDIAKAEVYSGL